MDEKYKYKYCIPDIQKKTGLSYQAISKRFRKLNIKGRRVGRDSTIYYRKIDVNRMVKHSPIYNENSSKKIDVVELYIEGYTGKEISKMLSMNVKSAYSTIREFNDTGCIIVESKINKVFL